MKKNFKLVLALVLALTLAMGMASAVAQVYPANAVQESGKGSITVENAAKGETYGLVKLFDATLSADNTGIAYTGTIPDALSAYFTKDEAQNIHIAKHEKNGEQVVWTDAEITAAVQAWAATQTASVEVVSDGSALTFVNLAYGYYAVKTTQGAVISIDSTKPTATIRDKNPKTPTATKEVNPNHGSVGDTVVYTAEFNAPNYLEKEVNGQKVSEQVVSYIIQDTLPAFLSNVTVTGVKIVHTPAVPAVEDNPETVEDESKAAVAEVATTLTAADYQFNNDKKIEIPWVAETVPTADHKYTSLYKNGSKIVITYSAVITSSAAIGAGNVNKVSLFPQVDRGSGKEPFQDRDEWNDTATIYTYAAALKKTDGTNKLAGAEFAFKGLTTIGDAGKYTVVGYDPSSNDNGTVMQCDSNGELVIGGIDKELTLVGTETKAPDGYNKLDGTFNLATILMSESTTTTWGSKVTYYDAEGNVVDSQVDGGSSETATVYNTIETIDPSKVVEVVNNKGTELPETGGIGTTIFYIGGSVLVLAAAILLITKRRMGNND